MPQPPRPHDPRNDDTPIPPVRELDKELEEYLRHKSEERREGYTNKHVLESIKTLTDDLLIHIEDDRKYQRATDRRIESLEDWRKQHADEHETLVTQGFLKTPSSIPPKSVPPMRNVADTGSYMLNARDLAEARAAIIALERKNERDLQALRDQQTADKLANQTAQILELKSDRKWWQESGIQWAVAALGGFLVALLTWFLAKH